MISGYYICKIEVVEGLGSFLSGCVMQLAKYTIHNHCLIMQPDNHSVIKTTNLFLLCVQYGSYQRVDRYLYKVVSLVC